MLTGPEFKMSKTKAKQKDARKGRDRLKKSDRRRQILLELKLRPHVRISDLARSFNVSTETVRRDFDALAKDGLLARAHGGASTASQGHYPSLDERTAARAAERTRIGETAAALVQEGDTVMIDSGSTTIQLARALALQGRSCTVITNSIPVAAALGDSAAVVILCPGEFLPAESAVIGADTLEYLSRFNVDRCLIGATGLTDEGVSEAISGFAAIKRMMLQRAANRHLLIDAQKFGCKGLVRAGALADLDSVVVDTAPTGPLRAALDAANVEIVLADLG